MKVLWDIAVILGATTCVLLSGCDSSHPSPSQSSSHVSLTPTVAPVIGKPILGSRENSPHFAMEIPIVNPGPGTLNAGIEIKGSPSEVLDSHRISGLSAGKGTTVFTICDITRKRTKPIFIKVKWQHDSKSGVSSFTVPPEQTNIVRE